MGAEIFVKFLKMGDKRIVLQVWDFGGEKEFHFLLPLYSRGSSGGIYMFDLTRIETLNRAEDWLDTFKSGLSPEKKDVPIILVGGKMDLKDQIVDSQNEAEKIRKQYNLFKYIKCSSKTGENVESIFESLLKRILEDFKLL